jgi:hypothetical protein
MRWRQFVQTVSGSSAAVGCQRLASSVKAQASGSDIPVLRELEQRGYRGSLRTVQRAVASWREGPTPRGRNTRRLGRKPPDVTWDHRPPSAAQAVRLLLLPLDRLTIEQQLMRQRLLEVAPELQQSRLEIMAFRRLLQERDSTGLEPRLSMAEAAQCRRSALLRRLSRRDRPAVQAALEYAWSSGRIEGLITKIKLVKRQMFGRGSQLPMRKEPLMAMRIVGIWDIVSSPDFDVEYLNQEGPPYVQLSDDRDRIVGEYHIALQNGTMDGRPQGDGSILDGRPQRDGSILFSFHGMDEMDEVHGAGTAALHDDRLAFTLMYQQGDDYTFEATRRS